MSSKISQRRNDNVINKDAESNKMESNVAMHPVNLK